MGIPATTWTVFKLLRPCQSEGICAYSLENLKIDSLYKEGVKKEKSRSIFDSNVLYKLKQHYQHLYSSKHLYIYVR